MSLVLVGIVAAAAGFLFLRVFGAGPLWRPVLIAAVVPVVLAVVEHASGRPRLIVTTLISAVVAIVAAGIVVFPSTTAAGFVPSASTLRAIDDGLQNGWARILTTSLPADATPALLFVPFAITFIASWCGAELAMRTRAVIAPAVPATVGLGLAFVFGVPGTGTTLIPVAVLIGACAGLALFRSAALRPASAGAASARGVPAGLGRRLAAGVPLAVVLAVVAPIVAPHLPGGASAHPYDPRNDRPAPPPTRPAVNPMSEIKARLADPGPVLFTFRSAGAVPDRITQVVLDRYDGVSWSTNASYIAAGHRLPAGSNAHVPSATVDLDISIEQLDGIWLPAPMRPRTMSGVPFGFDPTHDVLVAERPLNGARYTVSSTVPTPSAADLEHASVANDPADVALPQPVPTPLAQLAASAVVQATTPAGRAKALADFLQKRFSYPAHIAGAPTGQSYGTLRYLVDPQLGDFRGTPEQFASAYAVMARSLGLPTRVVAGFNVPPRDRDGVYRVRAGDVTAWPEVNFQGIGWVAFNPNPSSSKRAASGAPQQPSHLQDPTNDIQTHPSPSNATAGQQGPHIGQRHSSQGAATAWWLWLLVALGAVVALAVAALSCVWILKQRRARTRRRANTARARLLGAWREAVDGLREAHVPVTPELATTEVATVATGALGPRCGEPMWALGVLVNRSLYRRGGPADADADEAWLLADSFGDALHDGVSRRERLRRALDPRSLRPQR
jgi:hypothetical protein